MRAIKRSLSPFRRRKNVQELLDDVKAKEEVHMRMLTEPQIPREGPSIEVSVPQIDRERPRARRWFAANEKIPAEKLSYIIPEVEAPDTATTTLSKISLLAGCVNNSKSEVVPLPQSREDSVLRRSLGSTPFLGAMGSMTHKTRASSLERMVPFTRQVSLTDDSVMDISATLRQMETQLMTARKQGKRVSRAKVMGALMLVVDQLDAKQNEEGDAKPRPKSNLCTKPTLPVKEIPVKITVVNTHPDDEDDSFVSTPSSEYSETDSDSLSSEGTFSFDSEDSDEALRKGEVRKQSPRERGRARTRTTSPIKPANSFSSMGEMLWGDEPTNPSTAPIETKPEQQVANYTFSNSFCNTMGMSLAALPSTSKPRLAPSTVMCSPQVPCASPTNSQVPTKPKSLLGLGVRRFRKLSGPAKDARLISPKKSVSFDLPDLPAKGTASPERASWFALAEEEAENMKKAIADIFLMTESPPRKNADPDSVTARLNCAAPSSVPLRSTTISKSPPMISEPPVIQRATELGKPKTPKPEPPSFAMNDGDAYRHPLGELRRKLPLEWVEEDASDGSQPSGVASSLSDSPDRKPPSTRVFTKLKSFRSQTQEVPTAPPSKIVIDASARARFEDLEAQLRAEEEFGLADRRRPPSNRGLKSGSRRHLM